MKKGISFLIIGFLLASTVTMCAKTPVTSAPLSSQFVYCGGDNVQKVYQYWTSNMTKRTESQNYGGKIRAITSNGPYIYVGGYSTNTVWQLWASNLTKKAESISYGTIFALVCDGTYLYAAGDSPYKVYQFRASNLTKVRESISFGDIINSLALDADHVYVGGSYSVIQLRRSDLTQVASSPTYPGPIWGLLSDGTYVYAGTSSLVNNGVIKKFLAATMTEVASVEYGGSTFALTYDGTYLYAGGHNTQRVIKYWAYNLSEVAESADYGGYISELGYDGTSLYVTGRTTDKIWKLDPATLQKTAETQAYGGNVEALWNGPCLTTLDITMPKIGVFGFTATIKNIGTDEAINTEVTVAVDGGFFDKIHVGGTSYVIDPLNPDATTKAGIQPVLGIGKVTVTVSAKAVNAFETKKTATGFILGPIIIAL